MPRAYDALIPYVFQRFSILSARRSLLPTLWYYARKPALPPGDKPALFTMNILPPMMTVWYHLVRKHLGDRVDVVIFDCSGMLRRKDFPGAFVQKFLNPRHAMKCDQFVGNIARNRRIAWVCDDDVFPLSPRLVDILEREFGVPQTAAVSFMPRVWWEFDIGGKRYQPLGTYCLGVDHEIFVKERLSFAPANGNTHPSRIKPPKRYDSFDKANEILLRKGYRTVVVPEEEHGHGLACFHGLSAAVMLLHYFRKPEQTMDYLRGPEDKRWSGNVLFRVLAGLLSISAVQECYTRIAGKPYPLPSLPSPADLDRLRRDKTPFVRSDESFEEVDVTAQRLLRAL